MLDHGHNGEPRVVLLGTHAICRLADAETRIDVIWCDWAVVLVIGQAQARQNAPLKLPFYRAAHFPSNLLTRTRLIQAFNQLDLANSPFFSGQPQLHSYCSAYPAPLAEK